MLVRKYRCLAFVFALMMLTIGAALAKGQVTLDRILLEHTMHAVSTEKTSAISKYIFDLRMRDPSVITITDLLIKASHLQDEEGIFFIIDRSKIRNLSPEEEALLPCPTSAIDANQVILYSRKATGRNAWEILVSAPNQKWLQWELNRLCTSGLRDVRLDERGSILDRYLVKRLIVVSTEDRQTADAWIKGQTRPGGNAIDWDFVRVDAWKPDQNAGVDTVFLLDRQKMADKYPDVVKSLPRDLQSWISGGVSKAGVAAVKETVQGDQSFAIEAIVAACPRHLAAALAKYSSLDRIPGSLDEQRLHDLSSYEQMAVIVRSGDRSDGGSVLNDLGGKLNSALSRTDLGFVGVSRQDLKELIFQSIDKGDKIDSNELLQIRQKIGKACAFAVADLTAVDAKTTYVANSPNCESSPYPAFSSPEPSEPCEPNPDETILFKGKRYRLVNGSRKNDPHYINDLDNYKQNLLPEYRRAHRQWEHDRNDYESRRRYHDMEWSRSVDAVQSVKVSGNLRIYDAGSLGTDTAGQLIFSCSLNGNAERTATYKSDRVSVQGEDSRPDSMEAPEARSSVDDAGIVSDAIASACDSVVAEIKRTAVLPCDVPNYVPHPVSADAKPEIRTERVTVEAIGSTKVDARPIGVAVESARQAALADCCPKLISNISIACPGASISDDALKSGITIVSEGYSPLTREYRVKVRFQGEVTTTQPQVQVMK